VAPLKLRLNGDVQIYLLLLLLLLLLARLHEAIGGTAVKPAHLSPNDTE